MSYSNRGATGERSCSSPARVEPRSSSEGRACRLGYRSSLPAIASLSKARIRELLDGPHQAVLSVSREGKGPVAIPMSYLYDGDRFVMVTSPQSLHGRLMSGSGRATVTVQFERVTSDSVHQWYVMAEGTVAFTDDDPTPYVRAILVKDRGEANIERWRANEPDRGVKVAELIPKCISGYEFRESIDVETTPTRADET